MAALDAAALEDAFGELVAGEPEAREHLLLREHRGRVRHGECAIRTPGRAAIACRGDRSRRESTVRRGGCMAVGTGWRLLREAVGV